MFRFALPLTAWVWCLQFGDTQALLGIPAAAWALAALLCWCLFGGRAALLVLAAGWTFSRAGAQLDARFPESLAGLDVLVRGHVCDFARADADALRFILDAEDSPVHAPLRVHLSWYESPPDIRPGQRWQLLVRLHPPRGLSNPGAFDFEQWLYTRGIGAVGHVRASAMNRPLASFACSTGRLRDRLAGRIDRAIGAHPGAPYLLGIVVGATHRLGERDWELMRATGTTHLLAISGMNIAMVAAPFVLGWPWLTRLFPVLAFWPSSGPIAGLLAGSVYCALSGFALSTVRALLMLALSALLAVRRLRVSGLDLLGAAVIAMSVIEPAAVMTVSFWLSCVGVAWLYVLAMPDVAPMGPHRWLRAPYLMGRAQLVLGLGLAPLTLGWFQQLSLISPLTNLLAVPVFSFAVMPLALAGTALLLVVPAAGTVILRLAADIVWWLMDLLQGFAGLAHAVWHPAATGWWVLVPCAVAALLICWWRPVPWRSCALAMALPVVFGVRQPRPELAVTVFDVGQGLAVLVETRRHTLLYDAGPAFRNRDAGASVVLPVMRHRGVPGLDMLVLSHDDADHRGGVARVLEEFPAATFLAPVIAGPTANRSVLCRSGLSWVWDGVRFRVLSPRQADDWTSDNDSSCVLSVEAATSSVLLTGDIEQRRERALRLQGLLQPVELVLAPHHGSRSSSSPWLIEALRARFVVFSAGHRNRWGFPAAEVVDRWRSAGACLLDTAASGALHFATDEGGRLRLRWRQRADAAHLWTAQVPREPPCSS